MYEDDLAKVPLFTELGKRELQRIGAVCREQRYAAGDPLVWQGTPGTGFFVITAGKVRIMQQRADGDTRQLNVLGPGDTFGEMALLDELPRSTTALAVEPTTALVLPVWDFRAILKEDSEIALGLLKALSRRLRAVEQSQE
ncbi:MAG TPA: cyclic nucleotide-binding domain-containing protein [Ktedonobacterales bacterium]|jgi:CRP/FNR family cyclic AMP-dependent transcriptional regulator|nr:cyclic nucleotide-binding domain-containing protein [Ktedonobacterales bacterium]